MSFTTGNHDNHIGNILSNGTLDSKFLHILAMADIAFSVAFIAVLSSLALGFCTLITIESRASIMRERERERERVAHTVYYFKFHWRMVYVILLINFKQIHYYYEMAHCQVMYS